MTKTFQLTALALALLCAGMSTAQAQASRSLADDRNLSVQRAANPQPRISAQRIALVIGNANYKDAPLTNPVNDARAIAKALSDSGFTVILRENADQRGILAALREFGDKLRAGGTGLFYYAGHGMQIKGRNYLIPVGASIEREDEVAYSAVDAQAVLDKMEAAGNGANIMILDACRNNPFTRSTRSGQAGLAQMDAPVGTLVAFATSPGAVASDGAGSNGLYTQHLLEAMRKEGSKVEDVFKQVRANVRRDSLGKQVPWEATSLEGDFYFRGGAASGGQQLDLEQALWDAVKDSKVPIELRAYLNRFPAGRFAQQAREQLTKLQTPLTPIASLPEKSLLPTASTATRPTATPQSYTTVSALVRMNYVVGDTWTTVNDDLLTGNQTQSILRVSSIEANGNATLNDGAMIVTAEGIVRYDKSTRLARERFFEGDFRNITRELKIGHEESINFVVRNKPNEGKESRTTVNAKLRVVKRERVDTPAGNFMAWLIERDSVATTESGTLFDAKMKSWFAPEIKRIVAQEFVETSRATGKVTSQSRSALHNFRLSSNSDLLAAAKNMEQAAAAADAAKFDVIASSKEVQTAVDQRTKELLDQLYSLPSPAAAPPRPVAASNSAGYTVGDTWRFQIVDKFKKEVVSNWGRRIDGFSTDNTMRVNGGRVVWFADGSVKSQQNDDGSTRSFSNGFAWKPKQLHEGYTWDFKDTGTLLSATGAKNTWERYGKFKVIGKESVRVPAGEFEAWRIEFNGYGGTDKWQETVWYVPALRYFVATEVEVRRSSGQIERFERHELTSYSVRGADEALAKR